MTVPRALLVEDNPADARLVKELLAEDPEGFTLTVADRLSSALELLTHEQFSVVLVDLGLPDAARLEALDALRSSVGATPVVVYSGGADDAIATEARSLGVSDVLRKGSLDDGLALTAALRTIVDTAAFSEAVRQRLRAAKGTGDDIAVVRLVVERPATTAGSDAQLTRAVGERLAGRLRVDDGLYDLGEGRYGVVAVVDDGAEGAGVLAHDLSLTLERPVALERGTVALTARAGHAFALGGAGTADALLDRATTALREGGAPARPEMPSHRPLRRRGDDDPSFAARLRHAIASGEMVLHYQPIVRIDDDKVPLVEALVRWYDPVRGQLNPGDFIPLAEETSLIEEIGEWALMEACRQLHRWDEAGLPPVRCAVNLSARELCSAALPARVADALALSGVAADRLEIELTESMFADPETTSLVIARLRAVGVRVAIDDFGTGYSSLAYLTRFAVDTIKVDGAFVRRAAGDADAAAVVKAIVDIAHQLELEVVAEGVETLEQLAFARNQGCDLVQGWLFSAAMPGPQVAEWLRWAQAQAPTVPEPEPVAIAPVNPAHRSARRGRLRGELRTLVSGLRTSSRAYAATPDAHAAVPPPVAATPPRSGLLAERFAATTAGLRGVHRP